MQYRRQMALAHEITGSTLRHERGSKSRETDIARRIFYGFVEPYSLTLVIAESRSSIAEGVAADARQSGEDRPANGHTQGGGAIRGQLNARGG